MTKNFELLTFEELLNLPIDIESCFDPIFEPPADFIEEWYRDHEPQNPFSCKVTRKIGNTWYIVETECDGAEPLSSLMRRMIFQIRRRFDVDKTGRSCYHRAMHYGTVS